MNSNSYLFDISRYLGVFTSHIVLENNAGKFDVNKEVESFLAPILGRVFHKKFTRTEFLKVNYPAIDLISEDGQLGIQITAEKGIEKIRHTLSTYIDHRQFERFELIHLVLDDDFKTSVKETELREFIDTELLKLNPPSTGKVIFTRDSIWNMSDLRIAIEQKCSIQDLEQIREFLQSQYGNIIPEGYREILIPYDLYFEEKLNQGQSIEPYQFSNPFFGGENEMADLTKLLEESKNVVIAVVADGGLGKTRFCIEYFNTVIEPKGDAACYVFNERAFSGQLFPGRIGPNKKCFILVDDAHRKLGVLESLFVSARQYPEVQIILTVRKPLLTDVLDNLPTHEQDFARLPLTRFNYEDSIAFIGRQLALNERITAQIAEASKGVPFVILSLCSLAIQGKYTSEISGEDNFSAFVLNLKKQVIEDICDKTFFDPQPVNKLIELVSLLAPVANSEQEIRLLAALAGMQYEDCVVILEALSDHDFVSKRTTISLVADPYADVVIGRMIPQIKFILQKQESVTFKDRIIRNLAGVDQLQTEKLDIAAIVSDFITLMGQNPLSGYQDIVALENNLDTLKYFTYKRPVLGISAMRTLLQAFDAHTEFWNVEDGWTRFRTVNSSIDSIFGLIALGIHTESELNTLFDLVVDFTKKRRNYGLLGKTFRYRIYDFEEHGFRVHPCERQVFLTKKISQLAGQSTLGDHESELILMATRTLLAPDFSAEEWFNARTHQFHFGRYDVIDNATTKAIRDGVIRTLIDTYRRVRPAVISQKLFRQLIHPFYFIAIPQPKDKYQIDQASQINLVIQFLKELLKNSPTIWERSTIIHQLQLFDRRQIKEEFKSIRAELIAMAEIAKDNQERIDLLLRKEYFYKKDNFDKDFNQIRADYAEDEAQFFEDLVAIRRAMTEDPAPFGQLLNTIVATPQEAKKLFEYVKQKHKDLIVPFSDLIRANHHDTDYFYSEIEQLWKIQTDDATGSVISLLIHGRNRDITKYTHHDFKYIEMAISKNNYWARSILSVSLADFLALDVDVTLLLGIEFLKHDGRSFDNELMIDSLFDVRGDMYPERLKQFAFENTTALQVGVTYRDKILLFLEKHFGFNTMFDYFLKYVEATEREVGSHAIDLQQGAHINVNLTEEEKENNLLKVIEWYCSLETPLETRDEKIVAYFAPHNIFQTSLTDKILKLVQAHNGNLPMLLKIARALSFLNRENIKVLEFLVDLANRASKLPGCTYENIEDIFDRDFIWNYESRQGLGPGPFQQDIDKNKRLSQLVAEYPMEENVQKAFEVALDRTKTAIERMRVSNSSKTW